MRRLLPALSQYHDVAGSDDDDQAVSLAVVPRLGGTGRGGRRLAARPGGVLARVTLNLGYRLRWTIRLP